MGNYLLRKALDDPKLGGLECISLSSTIVPVLSSVVDNMPPNACVSEWRYGMGEIRYEYHIHVGEVAGQLRAAFEGGARGGHPRLTAVYSKDELKKFIVESEAGSVSRRDSQQIRY